MGLFNLLAWRTNYSTAVISIVSYYYTTWRERERERERGGGEKGEREGGREREKGKGKVISMCLLVHCGDVHLICF